MVDHSSVGVVNNDGVIVYDSISISSTLRNVLVKGRRKFVKLNLRRNSTTYVTAEIFIAVGIVPLA